MLETVPPSVKSDMHGADVCNPRIVSLLSVEANGLACGATARSLSRQGVSWSAVAKEFNRRPVPSPPPGKGRWTGPKLQALVDEPAP